MSGHLRFCIAAFVLLAGLPISPASSNPIADFFNTTPRRATPPAPAEEECLPQPGKSTAEGQHWVYRLEGNRKCWFQAAEGSAVKKQVRPRAAKPRVAAPEENEAARRKPKAVVDARAELLRSAPAETSKPMRPAPELKVADAASASGGPRLSCRRHPSKTRTDPCARPPRARSTWRRFWRPRRPPATRLPPPSPPAAPVAFRIAEAADDGRGWMATWLGVLLMALGLVSVLGSSRTLREAVLLRD